MHQVGLRWRVEQVLRGAAFLVQNCGVLHLQDTPSTAQVNPMCCLPTAGLQSRVWYWRAALGGHVIRPAFVGYSMR